MISESVNAVPRQEYYSTCKRIYDYLLHDKLPPTCCDTILERFYSIISSCKDVQIITLLVRILILLSESSFFIIISYSNRKSCFTSC